MLEDTDTTLLTGHGPLLMRLRCEQQQKYETLLSACPLLPAPVKTQGTRGHASRNLPEDLVKFAVEIRRTRVARHMTRPSARFPSSSDAAHFGI